MITTVVPKSIVRRRGRSFDCSRLGKSFREGANFMKYMKATAQRLMARAQERGDVRQLQRCRIRRNTAGDIQRVTDENEQGSNRHCVAGKPK